MTRAERARTAGAALLVLALAGACSPWTPQPGPPAPVRDAWPGCIAVGAFVGDQFGGPPATQVGTVPSDFAARSAVLCRSDLRPDAQGRLVLVDLEQTSTEIGPLLTYLGRPSERPTSGACPAIGIGRPWLFLLDGSARYLAPAIPTDACGLPLGWQSESSAWEVLPYTDQVLRTSPTR